MGSKTVSLVWELEFEVSGSRWFAGQKLRRRWGLEIQIEGLY